MNIFDVYHFVFETYQGVGVLVLVVLVLSVVMAVITERKIRKRYADRGFADPEDDWNSPDYED